MPTHYEILGVDPTSDVDAIKRAWRVKVVLLHPDKHARESDDVRAEAARETLLVNGAWETLKDPARRRIYDLQLAQLVDAATRTGGGDPPHWSNAAGGDVLVACAACNATQQLSSTAVRFVCARCKKAWRFAVCEKCHEHVDVNERWGRWTCHGCGHVHDSYWGGTVKKIKCVKCKSATEVAVGSPIFRCSGCAREYQRCVCGVYTSFPTVLGSRWRCRSCETVNVRVVDPETAQLRSIQQLLDERGIDAPGAAEALTGHIGPDLDGVARVGGRGDEGVVAVSGDRAAVWWRDGRPVETMNLRSMAAVERDGRRITLWTSTGTQLHVVASSNRYAKGWMTHMERLAARTKVHPVER